jgi:hypothetical protein
MAGCSLLIGVSGDPVVVDDGGDAEVEAAAVEGGDEPDSQIPSDAATADETDDGSADADDGAPE